MVWPKVKEACGPIQPLDSFVASCSICCVFLLLGNRHCNAGNAVEVQEYRKQVYKIVSDVVFSAQSKT